jgi:hypothetical protein
VPFLLDGDNLLGAQRSDERRQALAAELRHLAQRLGKRILIVFDGPGLDSSDVQFSGPGRSADDRILELLRGSQDRGGWIVVTDDRPLGDRCRTLGARVERCREFRGRLRSPDEPEKPERETDVAYWLERFGNR